MDQLFWLNTQEVLAMNFTQQIAQHMRAVHAGSNWTAVNLKDKLADITWQQATARVGTFHSIATLVFHINYYIDATIKVLGGGSLDAKDALSFDCPPITSAEQWEQLLDKTFRDADELASLIENLSDEKLADWFVEEKYGTYYRCLQGPIEHTYYHLGQIAMLKSMLPRAAES